MTVLVPVWLVVARRCSSGEREGGVVEGLCGARSTSREVWLPRPGGHRGT